jgi:DNA-binding NtrC family response regulator
VNYSPVIVCVDDEVNALAIRKSILQSQGYVVVTARNCEQALNVFNCIKVDLVISDHYLPGETGCDLAGKLKELNPEIPFLLLSGVTEIPLKANHVDVFLSKLEGPKRLLQVTAQLLMGRLSAAS